MATAMKALALALVLASCGAESPQDAGSAPSAPCVPAEIAVTLQITGAFRCSEAESCIAAKCPAQMLSFAGPDWKKGTYAGDCKDYIDCVATCGCNLDCAYDCRTKHGEGPACTNRAIEVATCRNDSCDAETKLCHK